MPLRDADENENDEALGAWRQGDVSLDSGLEVSVTAYMEPFHVRLNGATPCST